MKDILSQMWHAAAIQNRENIIEALGNADGMSLLDLGCWDGEWTSEIARSCKARDVSGVEIVDSAADLASERSINVIRADLGSTLPIPDQSYDLVHANQVIEHVPDVDVFMGEIARIVRPKGKIVISTENASSWCNVFASAMGWQSFSTTNISNRKGGVGNPFALHRSNPGASDSMRHKTVFSYRGLIEFTQAHGFERVSIRGAGYFPLPSIFGRIDPRHAHFITVSATKI